MSDRKLFDETIYTSLPEALTELDRRRGNIEIEKKVKVLLKNDNPEPFNSGPKAVIFRQLSTPNYEIRRFFSIVNAIEALEPLFWEYHHDKFTSNNEWKHSLGKLFFYHGKGKKDGSKIEAVKIIDFNSSNGKKIKDVQTLWGQSLIDFHHQFFNETFRTGIDSFFDATEWFHRQGGTAAKYYEPFLSLFIRHGILFENFMLDAKEADFTEKVFLPAFISVWKKTGYKPIIVSLEPTDIEGDQFWMCHPGEHKEMIVQKLALNK
jgi:hypothetical protein